ncbi:patatin family protein [Fictibacillus sp. WQ 8-8]|uniref:patatin-like phospholipase family protein n=1 Tax=unclassified Fictibacillus TaxID=2644029 RepID=UPI0007867CED|nr:MULTISPECIES: patatin family protein [unclassified Fictibacillus]MCQ6265398.1 patatin family protein [Fictibacillus sp. WQ 8-8]MED2973703.1 patatin family protein [Fictibacillus sp. B-59209]
MKGTGLVLEGGGMRGVYTAGVLDYFMDKELYFPYVIGVSAGACNATSYLSRQRGRNRVVNIDFVRHPEYISYKNLLLKRKGLFGMDLIFDEIPKKHVPFDFETFERATERFVIGTTDSETGLPVYFEKADHQEHILTVLRASASLPFMAPVIEYHGKKLLDGGVADPIPVKKAKADGNKRNVIVLTQNEGYRKRKTKMEWLARRVYQSQPGMSDVLLNRYKHYNETLDYIEELEKKNEVFVIRPKQKLDVGRAERNPVKLHALYERGIEDAMNVYEQLEEWLLLEKTH